jgi:hypothetical protein
MEIIKNEQLILTNDNGIYNIYFKSAAYSLINSLIKTRIIQGGSTNATYKQLTFKASSVKTLEEYQKDNLVSYGKKAILIPNLANMIRHLTTQLQYLIERESSTIIGYNTSDIIVINDEKFAFLGSEFIANIDDDMATISCPFSTNDFFISPELFTIKEIPSTIHFKTAYFSLGMLFIYMLLGEDEFYIDYIKHKQPKKIIDLLHNHPIKNTRLYWLLSRCLVEDPKDRCIILL